VTEGTLTVVNKLGLHARAASKLVQTASAYQAEVTLVRDHQRVSAKSIMGVMMLGAAQGTELGLVTEGPDEEAAYAAIRGLFADYFGEGE
jgi:phosphocarrier protein